VKRVWQISVFSIRDVSRNRWGLLYTAFFAAVTVGLFQFQVHGEKVAVSLIGLCLVLIPLVSVLFGSMYFYNSREFFELILTQPVGRSTVYLGMYLGLSAALVFGFLIGVGLPFLIFGMGDIAQLMSLFLLLVMGTFLTLIFLALSFLLAAIFDDRGKGLASALAVWLLAALIYDGMVLLVAMNFSDYPLETPLLILSLANPIDLARVTLLVQSDMAALMGYTGAVFNRFFGTSTGMILAILSLTVWTIGPLAIGLRRFQTKDM
jgi:Cu-processing system permease protein